MGKEKIHFEAPPAARVPQEMRGFLDWFNLGGPSEGGSLLDPVLKSAIAHLWFVTIHPFDDGNGRLARAIADMALARADRSTERYYSVSKEICQERKSYYAILEATQKGDLDISAWLSWYLGCVGRAISCAQGELLGARKRAEFWEGIGSASLNLRQKEMLRRLLDGFDGRLTTAKWAALCGCSQDTAGRDISALVEAGILRKGEGGGRSSWYELPALSEA
jgi:Fic family protein